jgi:hypothetical protein
MKQHTLRLLNFSLLVLLFFACKKDQGELHDFPRGRFNYTFLWNLNGVDHSLNGEVSGPYENTGHYRFTIRPQANVNYTSFTLAQNTKIYRILLDESDIYGDITSISHTDNQMDIQFQLGDSLNGSFNLIRIEK